MKHILYLFIASMALLTCQQQSEKSIYSFDKNRKTKWTKKEKAEWKITEPN
jgi:ribosomal protein L24E